jgi:MFS family permease
LCRCTRWSGGLVARYGARHPLIIGPLVTAAGFVLFAVPSVGGSYWTTFFPAFVVLGLGMAISVAPLTTVVMDAVDQNRAGAASGINNAVARVASLLAVAILGALMVRAFSVQLDHTLAKLNLPAAALHNLQSNEIRLAGTPIPPGLDSRSAAQVRASIDQAFIFAFRRIMLICATLAAASAAVSYRLIASNTNHPAPPH